MIDDNRILIVGAGPVGLALGCLLAASRTPFRLIDSKDGIGTESRALGIHARTLEIMQSLNLAEELIKVGRVTRYMTFHDRNTALFSLDFDVLKKDTQFPYYLIVPQCDTEAILYRKLQELGGEVEWSTSVRSIEDHSKSATAHFEGESLRYPYVVGCDGAASIVRSSLGIAFSGETYDARFLLSEVRIADDCLATDATHVIMTRESVLAAIPLPDGSYRLVGPDSLASQETQSGAAISFDAFSDFLKRNKLFPNIRFHDPSRVVSYRMQKRVADDFMGQHTFLAGDAAHIHSPAGGQGMNMGIQDVANLAWKLSIAFRRPNNQLLKSYATERRAIAETVAAGTDKALRMMAAPGPLSRFALRTLAPLVMRVRHPYKLIHGMAQLAINYTPKGQSVVGTRVPLIKLATGGDVFDLLMPGKPLVLHLSGENAKLLPCKGGVSQIVLVDNHFYRADPTRNPSLGLRPVLSTELAKLPNAARILIRPDGYVAAVDETAASHNITDLLVNWGFGNG